MASPQTLSQYFPSSQIAPKGSVTANFVFRGLAAPVIKTFVFTGTDPTGVVWTRQVAINFLALPTYDYFNLNATPLTAVQNPANAACPWSVQLNVDDLGGYGVNIIDDLESGNVDLLEQHRVDLRHHAPRCLRRTARYALLFRHHSSRDRCDLCRVKRWSKIII